MASPGKMNFASVLQAASSALSGAKANAIKAYTRRASACQRQADG